MAYEIDFVGSPNAQKDYDAIAFRYWSVREDRWIVCVFDGGTAEAGKDLCSHLGEYYLDEGITPIDYVFVLIQTEITPPVSEQFFRSFQFAILS